MTYAVNCNAMDPDSVTGLFPISDANDKWCYSYESCTFHYVSTAAELEWLSFVLSVIHCMIYYYTVLVSLAFALTDSMRSKPGS